MQIKLTAAQQQAILHELQAGSKQPVAPFPCSLLERGLNAVFDGVETLVCWVVGVVATLLRLPKAT